MEKRQDVILGLLFTGLGLAAAWIALSYSGAGGIYPAVLSLVMASIGLLIASRAAKKSRDVPRVLMDAPFKLFLTIAACALYVAMVTVLGFYTASLSLLLLLPVLLGFRRPLFLGLTACLFMLVVWVLFSLVLEKPLPAEIWSQARTAGS